MGVCVIHHEYAASSVCVCVCVCEAYYNSSSILLTLVTKDFVEQ
jgi:hypothetical protein